MTIYIDWEFMYTHIYIYYNKKSLMYTCVYLWNIVYTLNSNNNDNLIVNNNRK